MGWVRYILLKIISIFQAEKVMNLLHYLGESSSSRKNGLIGFYQLNMMGQIILSVDYFARDSFRDSALNTSLIGLLHSVKS